MQKFSWYRSRLKAMPAKEVAYRTAGGFWAEKEIRFPPHKCRLACFDPSRTGVPSTMPRFYFDRSDALFQMGEKEEAISKLNEFENKLKPTVDYQVKTV